jgi:hypothetical protein
MTLLFIMLCGLVPYAVIALYFYLDIYNIKFKNFLKSKVSSKFILPNQARKNVKLFKKNQEEMQKKAALESKSNKELFDLMLALIKQKSSKGCSKFSVSSLKPSNYIEAANHYRMFSRNSESFSKENYQAVSVMLGDLGFFASFDGETLDVSW